MSAGEIYFWTVLPRMGTHLGIISAFLFFLAALMGTASLVEGVERFYKPVIVMLVVASICGWGWVLIPDDEQVKQIVEGKMK